MKGSSSYLRWPYRRLILDKDLCKYIEYIKGIVIDVGGGENVGSGNFRLPEEETKIISLNRDIQSVPNIVGDAEVIPLKGNVADVVLCLETLEHIANPGKALAEIYRIIKKGGFLVLSMPFLYKIHGAPFDFQRYTGDKFKKILKDNGFSVRVLKKQGYFFTTMYDLWKTALAKARSNIILFGILAPLGIISLLLMRLLIPLEHTRFIKHSKIMTDFTEGFFVICQKPK